MELDAYNETMKDIYQALIDFIEATDNSIDEFQTLIEVLDKNEITQKIEEIQTLFQLISKITDNHHRTSDFFNRIEQFFQYLIDNIPSSISNFIPDYDNYNKQVLFLLLKESFIIPDQTFISKYLARRQKWGTFSVERFHSFYYLYPVMKKFIDENVRKQIEEEILQKIEEDDISIFEKKCQLGENDSYICSLIREDSVEEFISYVNRTNLSLSSKIKPSFYETNSFLINKKPTLIEYAAFFGSMQIIRYLKNYKVPLTSSLWLYSIHSNNAELIHFLEDNEVKPQSNSNFYKSKNENCYDNILIESIKCHHNAISNYIKDNLLEQNGQIDQNKFNNNFGLEVTNSLNFYFYPNDISSIISKPRNIKGFILCNLCFSLTTLQIPSSVTSIEFHAFRGCSSLIQIKIPSSVISIGNYAFSGCSSLTQITIPSSVTKIGEYAFEGCSSLTEVTINSSIISIGNYTFSECSSLTQITIPSSVTSIGYDAFKKCSALTQITIPSSVTSIGEYAFEGCSSLTEVMMPFSVTSIGYNAFKDCPLILHDLMQNINNTPKYQSYYNIIQKTTCEKNENKLDLDDENIQKLMNEVEIMKMLNHPNVVKIHGLLYSDKKNPSIKLENCHFNLNQAIQKKMLSKVQIDYLIYQFAEGMKFVHSCNIIHLNLKPENVLISDDLILKISDFKNAQKVTFENKGDEIKDIYSFGEIVYFILSGNNINNSEKEKVIKSFSLLAQQLIEACFYDDISCRPSFEMICDVLEENNFNLNSLSQQEIKEVTEKIDKYKKQIKNYS